MAQAASKGQEPSEAAWERAARDICEIGRLLYERGYVAANDGNVSVRVGPGAFLVTPSGVSKGRMTPDMLVRCDAAGRVLPHDRSGRKPSSEVAMHLRVYAERPDVGGVVHAHPVYSTAFAVCRHALAEPFLPELVVNFGRVPVADFAMPSTEEVPDSIAPYLRDYNACLLANHGALAWGADAWQAFDRLEDVEHTAKIYKAVLEMGEGARLSPEQVDGLLELRGYYRDRARVGDGTSGVHDDETEARDGRQ